ncbi:MAG: hypothetical protein HS109_03170 [Burkholderiales bacterium]|nr:hypothetical protein [Burkholderiales bacterium]MCE7877813.1 hypothetical protein [Betaproteobacteria bacterium PRO3]
MPRGARREGGAMDFRVEQRGDGLLVRIVTAERDEQAIFDRICACRRTSWWSCPSGECAKIDACETRLDGDATVLALTPRPGEALSAVGVKECLRYMLDDAAAAATGGAAPPER